MPGEVELLTLLQGLDLKTILATLAAEKIAGYAGKELAKVKQLVKDKWNEHKYAYVPNKDEAILLKQECDKPDYKKVAALIPFHPHLDLISTGLLLRDYQEDGTRAGKVRVAEIKKEICQRPNFVFLMKIVNLPTTPFFSTVLDYLVACRDKGYTNEQLKAEFSQIIIGWQDTTMFVDARRHTAKDIVSFTKSQITKNAGVFFLLGMNIQADKVTEALEDMKSRDMFEKSGYAHIVKESFAAKDRKIEVTIFKITEH